MICTAQLILGCERTHMAIEENCLDGQFAIHAATGRPRTTHAAGARARHQRHKQRQPPLVFLAAASCLSVIRSILDAVDSPQDTTAAGPSFVAVLIAASA